MCSEFELRMPLPGSQRLCTPFLRLGDEMIPWPSESGVIALHLSEFCGKVYQFCDRRVSKGAWNAFCISFWVWFLPVILAKMVVSGSGPGYKNCPQSGKEKPQTFAPKKVPLFPFQPAVAGWCEMNGKGVVPFPLSCLKIENSKIGHNLPILKWVWASAQSKLRLTASLFHKKSFFTSKPPFPI